MELLFHKQYSLSDGGTGILFKSQKDLAQAIIDLGEYTKIESLQPYLCMAFKPVGSPRSRPLPRRMHEAILKASYIRLKDDSALRSDFKTEFLESIIALKKQNISISKNDDVYQEFMEWIEESPYQCVITNDPTELYWKTNDRAKELMESLLNTLVVWDGSKYVINTERHYEFYLSKKGIIVDFWSSVASYARSEWSQRGNFLNIDELLIEINEVIGSLKVFLVDEEECTMPCVYFNKTNDQGLTYSCLFHLYFNTESTVSILKMPDAHLKQWFALKYIPLTHGVGNPKNVKEFQYSTTLIRHNK